jgi:hypothetical protein
MIVIPAAYSGIDDKKPYQEFSMIRLSDIIMDCGRLALTYNV